MLFTLYVVNKAGGLIYTRVRSSASSTPDITTCCNLTTNVLQDLNPVPRLGGGNEYLRLASTFHSLHAISKQLAPVRSGGIDVVDGPAFSLYCFETPTGVKFFVTARSRKDSANTSAASGAAAVSPSDVMIFLRKVYEFYGDFVLKNPFYEIDMPIRLRLFDSAIETYVRAVGLGTGQGLGDQKSGVPGSVGQPMFAGTASAAPMFAGTSNS